MNKLLPLLLFLSIPIFSNAQVFEKTYHDAPMVFGEVVASIGNGEILVGTQSGQFLGFGSFTPELHKLDSDGNTIWRNILNSGFVFGDMKMVRDIEILNENEYFVLLTYEGCDYGGWHKLIKIDGNGNTIWSVIELGYSFENPKMTLLENGNIVVISALDIYLISPEGLLLQSESMQFKANDVAEYSDSSIVIAAESGYAKIELNQDPFVYSYFTDDINYHKIKKYDSGELLILQDAGVWKLDVNLDKQDSFFFDFQNQFLTFDLDENNFYLFGRSQEDSLLVRSMNFDFEWQNDFILGGKNMIPRDLKVDNENLIMTAVNQDGYISNFNEVNYSIGIAPFGIGNSSLWVKSFPKNSLPSKAPIDIGVSNIQTGLVEIIDSLNCGFGEAEASFYFHELKITVKNYGTESVSNFKLNSLFELCPFICPSWISYHDEYVNVLLQPGAEIEFDLGTLFIPVLNYSGDEYDLCFWTSNPDDKTDINFSNNQFCLTIDDIVLVTDLENLVEENPFEVFPNPTNNILNIKWPENMEAKNSSIFIFDTFGKVVQEILLKNNAQEEIDLGDFAAGIYFVKIISGKGESYTQRVVKN